MGSEIESLRSAMCNAGDGCNFEMRLVEIKVGFFLKNPTSDLGENGRKTHVVRESAIEQVYGDEERF